MYKYLYNTAHPFSLIILNIMKFYSVLLGSLMLVGCMFSNSSDIKKAEQIFENFQCNNIESTQIVRTSITSYHERALHSSKQKAENYIESYKQGEKLFTIPLSEVIEQQYLIYKEACQNLGGLQVTSEVEIP